MTSTILKSGYINTDEMRLGFINIWGIGTTNVTEVTLKYKGNQASLKFVSEPTQEVSDIRKKILMKLFKMST